MLSMTSPGLLWLCRAPSTRSSFELWPSFELLRGECREVKITLSVGLPARDSYSPHAHQAVSFDTNFVLPCLEWAECLLNLVWPSVINVGQDLTQDRVPSRCFPDITEGDWKGVYLTNVEDAVCFHLLQSCGGKRKS